MSEPDWRAAFDAAQTARRANVVCMKWGTRYGPEWVNRLFAMVQRHTTWDVRFVCFTDDATGIRADVECQPLPQVHFDADRIGRYWPKLGLMQDGLGGLTGMTLFLDLDLVIVDSLDPFFTQPGRFLLLDGVPDALEEQNGSRMLGAHVLRLLQQSHRALEVASFEQRFGGGVLFLEIARSCFGGVASRLCLLDAP